MQVLKVGLVAVLVASSVAGCATKRYGRLTEVSGVESNFYTCREIQLEKAKVEAFRLQVAQGAQIDWRSVAGFLGDYGIGNAMEKSDAERSAATRMNSLMALEAQKGCVGGAESAATTQRPLGSPVAMAPAIAASPRPTDKQCRSGIRVVGDPDALKCF